MAVIIQSLLLIALSLYLYVYSQTLFLAVMPFSVLTACFALGKLWNASRKTRQYSDFMRQDITRSLDELLVNVSVAIASSDESDHLSWANERFYSYFPDVRENDCDLRQLLGVTALKPGDTVRFGYGGGFFEGVVHSRTDAESGRVVKTISITDTTRLCTLEVSEREDKPIVMIIAVDGYDEMFDGTPESDKARVTAQIDKMMEEYIASTNGIMKKFNRDRLWAVIEQKNIDKLIKEKVGLLDHAREIAVSDRNCVTLSIGIGATGQNLAESDKFAREALEMAIGRGGDQAAVKTENGFEFYGGVAQGVEKQTKVKSRIFANNLLGYAEKSDGVFIMGHRGSDLDSVGSSAGLTATLRSRGIVAYAVADQATSLAGELLDRLKSADPAEPLFITPTAARELFTEDSLLIVVDTHNPVLVEDKLLLQNAEKIIVIDHHRKMVSFISNTLAFHHEPNASSASEMVTEIVQNIGGGKFSPLCAEALLAGIMLDTKGFSLRTSVRTFEAAAFLRKLGADTLNVKMLFSNSFESYKKKVALAATSKVYRKCAILTSELLDPAMRIIAPQTADEMLGIRNMDASFVVYRTAADEFSISARSHGTLNVQLIMEILGGGGHQNMSGAQLRGVSLFEAENKLTSAIDRYLADKAGATTTA